MKLHPPTAAVRESFSQAQRQAADMSGPVAPWHAPAGTARRGRLRWTGLAVASLMAGGAAAWWVADSGPPAAAGKAESRVVVASPAAPPVVVTATIDAVPTTATPAPTPSVTRLPSGEIRIATTDAALTDVVARLARATHTTVQGAAALGAVSRPVTLNWQGRDVAAAWDALLGRYANIAVSCSGAACEVWIVGVSSPRNAGDATTASRPMAPVYAPPPTGDETETN